MWCLSANLQISVFSFTLYYLSSAWTHYVSFCHMRASCLFCSLFVSGWSFIWSHHTHTYRAYTYYHDCCDGCTSSHLTLTFQANLILSLSTFWFQLIKCEYFVVSVLLSDSKLKVFGLWAKTRYSGRQWSTFFTNFCHFMDQTTNIFIEKIDWSDSNNTLLVRCLST